MLRVGSNVVIDGLSERADLNGSIGVITSYSNEQQRWIIMVDGEPKKLAMKPSRLEVLAEWSWATGTDTWRPYDAAICARLTRTPWAWPPSRGPTTSTRRSRSP